MRNNLSVEEYKLLSAIFISHIRRSVVISMLNGCIFPNQIQKETDFHFSSISKVLGKLSQLGIVKCQNPSDKMGRVYILSKEVKELEDIIRKWNMTHKKLNKHSS